MAHCPNLLKMSGKILVSYVWRELHPKRKDLTHYSAAHKVYLRIDFFLIQKKYLGLIEDWGIVVSDVLDHSAVYLKVNLRGGQNTLWTLKMGILNHNSIKDKIRSEIQNHLEDNDKGDTGPVILWDALKAVLRGNLLLSQVA